ncbi:MAG: hypothetical protein KTQ49_04130 [Candidatus Omnitrophica bacterium]|nr:hypothetical protein [Candidatus Omnitrophota bacterium]
MEHLKRLDSLVIREKKKYAGMPANWKIQPLCCMEGVSGEEVYYAVTEKGGSPGWDGLRAARAFTMYLVNRKGQEALFFVRKTGLFENKLEVFDGNESLLGSVHKQPGHAKSSFRVQGAANRVLYQVEGPAEEPEILHIYQNGIVAGKISRKLAGVDEEGGPKRGHFGIVFPLGADLEEKAVLTGALFLIDNLF